MNNKNALFIINKFSGGGYRPEVEGRIIEKCKESGIECRIEFTQKRGHATELSQWAVDQKMDMVFAVGGDGTVNETAQGLIGSNLAMGIFPKGSGNGLARHLRVPMGFKEYLQLISSHQVELIDTMYINGNVSVNVSGIGFDGHVAGMFANKKKRGLFGYAKLVINEFRKFKSFEAAVEMNGNKFQAKSFIIAIANSSQFGNNAKVAPQASVLDQLMDVSFIRKIPLSEIIGFAGKMFSGNLDKSSFVDMHKSKRISIQLTEPMAFHIDGEAFSPIREFEAVINPASLRVLVPIRGNKTQVDKYPI